MAIVRSYEVAGSAPAVVTEFESIFGDLKNLPYQDGLISCRQYWPGATATGGAGGVFKAVNGTTLTVDNVKIFAGNGCRWVRQDCEVITAEHAGCLKGDIRPWEVYLNPQTQHASIALLSDKFANLAAAQAWYPGARLNNPAKVSRGETAAQAFASDINSVALQHALTLYSVKASAGVYRIQRPIEYFSFMNLTGDGGDSSQTVFVVENQNALIARRSSDLPPSPNPSYLPSDEWYKKGMTIKGIHFVGTSVVLANNQFAQPNVLDTTGFDQTKSGFYGSYRNPDLSTPESQDAHPNVIECTFEDLVFERFLGHGFSIGLGFNNEINAVKGDNNKGFGLHTFDGNSTIHQNCYQGKYNSSGGFWPQNGGTIINCNGYDHYDSRPGMVLGTPGSPNRIYALVQGGNIEGTKNDGVRIHGDGGKISFIDTSLQYTIDSIDDCPIRVYGGQNDIILGFSAISPTTNSLKDGGGNFVKPRNLIRSRGNQNNFTVLTPMRFLTENYSYLCVDAAGDPGGFYGLNGGIPLVPSNRTGFNNAAEYGLQLINHKASILEKLWIGTGTNLFAVGSVDTTAALPTIAAKPGIYYNTNPARTKANTLFIKIGDPAVTIPDNVGWFAVSIV